MSALPAAYAHVLALGPLWISVHCAGMCGPLLCGLGVGGGGRTVGRGALGVLAYQAGRGLTYAWLGGLAGLVGAGLGRIFTAAGGGLALGLGLALLGSVVRGRLAPTEAGQPRIPLGRPRPDLITATASRVRQLLGPLLLGDHPLREVALGTVMGLLPCMIPAWALGQAAVAGSPLHGAAIMLLLVAMTTPVLLITTQLPRLGRFFPTAPRRILGALLPAVSGIWLILVGGAGLSLWSHHHVGLSVLGHPLMMMLF